LAQRPIEGRAPADPLRARQGKDAPRLIEPQSERACSWMGPDFDRPGEAGEAQRLRADGRQDAIPGRQHRPR
jgi:hypothetical protein